MHLNTEFKHIKKYTPSYIIYLQYNVVKTHDKIISNISKVIQFILYYSITFIILQTQHII